MELSACIVVYNGAEEALRAAQTVLDCTLRYPLTLYLVDNASPDGSGQRLAKAAKDGTLRTRENQKVEVLCRTENGGFGTGHNTVLSLLHSRVHFILNPDIQLTGDTLSDLADWMVQHPGAVMTRPALTFPDGRPQRLPLRRCNVRAMVYRQLPCLKFWAKYNERYLMADKDLTKPVEIEFCTGSCRSPHKPLPVKTGQRSVRRRSAVPNLKIIFPLKMRKATRRAFQIVPAYHAKPHLEK